MLYTNRISMFLFFALMAMALVGCDKGSPMSSMEMENSTEVVGNAPVSEQTESRAVRPFASKVAVYAAGHLPNFPSGIYTIKSAANNKYVRAFVYRTGSPLLADYSDPTDPVAQFELVNHGGGKITFRNLATGKYVAQGSGGQLENQSDSGAMFDLWAEYTPGEISINAPGGNWVSARLDDPDAPLKSVASSSQAWERFIFDHINGRQTYSTRVPFATTNQSMWDANQATAQSYNGTLISLPWNVDLNVDETAMVEVVPGVPETVTYIDVPKVRTESYTETYWDIWTLTWKTRPATRSVAYIDREEIRTPGIAPVVAQFGVQLNAHTHGSVGLDYRFAYDAGSVNVSYPVDVQLDLPEMVRPGETFTVNSSFTVDGAASLTTASPNALLSVDVTYDVHASMSGTVYAGSDGSVSINPPNLDVGPGIFNLLELDTHDLSMTTDIEKDMEIKFTSKKEKKKVEFSFMGSIEAKMPHIETSGQLNGRRLVASGEDDFLNARADVDGIISSFPSIPPFELDVDLPPVAGQETGSVTLTAVDIQAGPSLFAQQAFDFDPIVMGRLDLSTGQSVTFRVGEPVTITIPASASSDVVITPTFWVQNTFRSQTSLRIDPVVSVDALKVEADLADFINEPVPGVTGVEDFEQAPAYSEEKRFSLPEQTHIALFDQSWELQGFDTFTTAPITLSLLGGSPVLAGQ